VRNEPDTWGLVAVPATLLLYALAIGVGKAIRLALDLVG
jgi:hypothetical protein